MENKKKITGYMGKLFTHEYTDYVIVYITSIESTHNNFSEQSTIHMIKNLFARE